MSPRRSGMKALVGTGGNISRGDTGDGCRNGLGGAGRRGDGRRNVEISEKRIL